jgi:nucleoid DNA-binding protein
MRAPTKSLGVSAILPYSLHQEHVPTSIFPDTVARFKEVSMAENTAKSMTKSAILAELAETTGLTRNEVSSIFEALSDRLIKRELSKKGPGTFILPGLLKIKRIHKAATKKQLKPNPFKPGEMMEVQAKPARSIVKAQCLKNLKDLVK